ncbi:MAG TPA: alpha/beta family hydrolase [Candidatus Limnocylindrales bacterium]
MGVCHRGYAVGVAPVYLGHGASGGPETMRPWVEGLRDRGFDARTLALPRRRAEDAVPALLAQVDPTGPVVVGGHSFGGRVASLAVAGSLATRAAALVCLSYPLHPPGRTENWDARTAHWARIGCPVLLLSGESDPFARLDLLRGAVRRLPQATLVTYPSVGHGLRPVMDDALERIAAFLVS